MIPNYFISSYAIVEFLLYIEGKIVPYDSPYQRDITVGKTLCAALFPLIFSALTQLANVILLGLEFTCFVMLGLLLGSLYIIVVGTLRSIDRFHEICCCDCYTDVCDDLRYIFSGTRKTRVPLASLEV